MQKKIIAIGGGENGRFLEDGSKTEYETKIIDEEIIRLNSHIEQVRQTLELREPVGRKLDFIVQEMNRETNTIGSKSCDMEMTNIVIDIKNILEKIREQVQNIE